MRAFLLSLATLLSLAGSALGQGFQYSASVGYPCYDPDPASATLRVEWIRAHPTEPDMIWFDVEKEGAHPTTGVLFRSLGTATIPLPYGSESLCLPRQTLGVVAWSQDNDPHMPPPFENYQIPTWDGLGPLFIVEETSDVLFSDSVTYQCLFRGAGSFELTNAANVSCTYL